MLIFAKNPDRKIKACQRFEYNFLLKQKLATGIYINVVAQITSFHVSGQRTFNFQKGDRAHKSSEAPRGDETF
jgi:hypothetical protein